MEQLILRPVITEKYTRLSERDDKEKQYAFEVAMEANKIQIKNAIEAIYGVEVKSVRTLIKRAERVSRYTRTRIIRGKTKRIKRAIVTLPMGQEIDFFENV